MKWVTRSHFHVENIERQFEIYDALYAWCRLDVAKGES